MGITSAGMEQRDAGCEGLGGLNGGQILRITAFFQSYHLHAYGLGMRQAKAKLFAQPGWKWATQKSVCLLNEPRAPLYTHNGEKLQKINVRFAGLVSKTCRFALAINVLIKKNRWQSDYWLT